MVRIYNNPLPHQIQQPQPNMQYPPPGYDETNKPNQNQNQWQSYHQQEQRSHSPYPPAYSPQDAPPTGPPGPYDANPAENQEYYRPPSQPNYPQNQPYQPHGYPPYNDGYKNQPRPYPPQQYGQQCPQQYQPPYGSSPAPAGYQPPSPSGHPIPPAGTQPQAPLAQTDEEEEKGIMGAIAGGAAGGYAGHKLNHGLIGTLGGAYAGHKLEEAYKEHHKPPTPIPAPHAAPPIPTSSRPNPPPNPYAPPPHIQMAGNFSASSINITLDGDYDLIASCSSVNGSQKLSSISLNNILTNEDGHFKWVGAGGNFGASARDVRLVEGGRVLEAELADCGGTWRRDRIWLDEKITNSDGDLRML